MEKMNENKNDQSEKKEKRESITIERFTLILRILIIIAFVMTIAEDMLTFFSDEPVALIINGVIWTRKASAFALFDRMVIFGTVNLKTIMWLIGLYQIWKLCRLYNRGSFFTVENARCFANVGWALMGMALMSTIIVPFVGAFLKYRKIIDYMPDLRVTLIDFDLLVAGLFFWLIAKIMERAAEMREEADLTI